MAELVAKTISPAGTAPAHQAADGDGDTVRANSRVFLHVVNGGGASVTVTVNDQGTAEPLGAIAFDPDVEVVVPDGGERFIGPLSPERFAGEGGVAEVSYSDVSDVEVAALRI